MSEAPGPAGSTPPESTSGPDSPQAQIPPTRVEPTSPHPVGPDQAEKPRSKPWYRTRKGIAAIVIVAVLAVAVIGSLGQGAGSPAGTASPNTAIGSSTPAASAPTQAESLTAPSETSAAAASALSSPPAASALDSGSSDQGITFGELVKLGGGLPTVGVLMENTTDQVMTFTVKATYLDGQTIVATAVGAVNNFLPKSQRAATLIVDGDTSKATSSSVAIDTLISQDASTAEGDAAMKFTFGPPRLSTLGMDVQVTNGDTATHTLTVGCAVLRGGALVGIGTGALNDIAGGQTKTATLLVSGDAKESDDFVLYVDSLIE